MKAVVALAGLLAAPVVAAGSARPRVAVVEPAQDDPFLRETVTRLAAELGAAGFDPVRVESLSPDPRASLGGGDSGGEVMATFAIARVGSQPAVDVWLLDRITHKTTVRRLAVDAATPELGPTALAIRAVELLRASVVELALPHPPAQAPVPAAVETMVARVRAPPDPVVGRSVALGVGWLASADALPGALAPALSLGAGLGRRWGVRVTVAGPGQSRDVSTASGTARVRQELALIAALWALRGADARVVPYLLAGAGAYHLQAVGRSSAPFVGQSDDVWAVAVACGGGLALRLGSRLAVQIESALVVTAPGARVDVGGVIAGSAGRPSWLSTGGVAWAF